jgi:nucleotide-binding universal stress UspA family protein
MRHILLGTDGSPSARKAEETARDLLNAYPQARLTALFVIKVIYDGNMALPAAGIQDDTSQELEHSFLRSFAEFSDRIQFRSAVGTPAQLICEMAQEVDADLILLGSHSRRAMGRILLGSVGDAVVHHADRSVLIAR